MLALSFGLPVVLWASAFAAAPIIIHLLMRTKPRKVIFPALRFVKKTHRANISKLRLKHLILLAMRVGVILLLVALIARANIENLGFAGDSQKPSAAVIIIDNSGSMNYRLAGADANLLTSARLTADRIVRQLPKNMRIAILNTSSPSVNSGFVSDKILASSMIAEITEGFGRGNLSATISNAQKMLAETDAANMDIFILTDMTSSAWDGVSAMAGGNNIRYSVLDLGCGKSANIALGAVHLNSQTVPAGADIVIKTPLSSTNLGGEMFIAVDTAGRAAVQITKKLPVGQSVWTSAVFPAPSNDHRKKNKTSVLSGKIVLKNSDSLDIDNVRYFTVLLEKRKDLFLVRDPSTIGQGGRTEILMSAAVAPATETAAGNWVRVITANSDRFNAENIPDGSIVMLADVSSLTRLQWRRTEDFVRRGGLLWIVSGGLMSTASYNSPSAKRVMPAEIASIEESQNSFLLAKPQLQAELLKPFANQENPPLSEIRFYRRFAIKSPASNTQTVLAYADGTDAIMTRRIGKGSVVFWNFSPSREWSNLARLPQFVILAQRTVRIFQGADNHPTMFTWGSRVVIPVPHNLQSPAAMVHKPSDTSGQRATIDLENGTLTILADEIGHWFVEFSAGNKRIRTGFSVNADPAESDLTPADAKKIKKKFPHGKIVIANNLDKLLTGRNKIRGDLDLTIPLLLGMFILITLEAFLANRFYTSHVKN